MQTDDRQPQIQLGSILYFGQFLFQRCEPCLSQCPWAGLQKPEEACAVGDGDNLHGEADYNDLREDSTRLVRPGEVLTGRSPCMCMRMRMRAVLCVMCHLRHVGVMCHLCRVVCHVSFVSCCVSRVICRVGCHVSFVSCWVSYVICVVLGPPTVWHWRPFFRRVERPWSEVNVTQ